MTAESPALTVRQGRGREGANPLLAVLRWELYRLGANRFDWLIAAAAVLFFTALLWFKHSWNVQLSDGGPGITVVGSSAVGMLHELVFVLLLLFGMFLPFVAAEGVARDYQQRVHELLMTTPLPNWAYVGGRYLAMLLVSLGLAAGLLAATWLVDSGLHLTNAAYPAPDVATLLALWAITVLPSTILLGGTSFALGTLWPRRATPLKLVVLVVWVALAGVGEGHVPAWFPYWNPTSYSLPAASEVQLVRQYRAQTLSGATDHLAVTRTLQTHLLDLQPWLLPHLGLIAIGIGLAVVATARFRRFRSVI